MCPPKCVETACPVCVCICLVLTLLLCTHHHTPSTTPPPPLPSPPLRSPPLPYLPLSPLPLPSLLTLCSTLQWCVDDLARYQNGQLSIIGPLGLFSGFLWSLPSPPLTSLQLSLHADILHSCASRHSAQPICPFPNSGRDLHADILHSCASRRSAQPICPFPNSGRALLLVVAGVQCEPLCG